MGLQKRGLDHLMQHAAALRFREVLRLGLVRTI